MELIVFNFLKSDYDTTKFAMFGQLDYDISEKSLLSFGFRVENQAQEYTGAIIKFNCMEG